MPDLPSESPKGLATGREIDRMAVLSVLGSSALTAAYMMAEMYLRGTLVWDGRNFALWFATFVVLWYPLVKAKVNAGEATPPARPTETAK